MLLSEGFAALHLRFADRVSRLVGIELTDALRHWTPAGRQAAAAWAEVGSAPDAQWLWRAYQSGPSARTRPTFGCFYQTPTADPRVLRLHFANVEGPGVLAHSPCAAANWPGCSPMLAQAVRCLTCSAEVRGCTTWPHTARCSRRHSSHRRCRRVRETH